MLLTRLITAAVIAGCCVWVWPAFGQGPASEAPGHGEASAAARESQSAHGEGGAGAHGAEGGLNPISWRTDLAIWTAVVFLVFVAVLWKFAWGPIRDGLDKRERRIADDIASAERANQEARQVLADYQQKLANSEEEVRRMIEQARRDAERAGQEIVDKARAAADAEHRRALAEIETATAGALKELAERSATLAVDLAGKIVGSRLDASSHSRLIEQAVADFTRGNSGKH